jgi:hypothetical protein
MSIDRHYCWPDPKNDSVLQELVPLFLLDQIQLSARWLVALRLLAWQVLLGTDPRAQSNLALRPRRPSLK